MAETNNILLIDDDKFLLDMYTTKFIQQGFNVEACLSVDDALHALKAGNVPKVILFDITMPERDGFALLQALHDEKLAPEALKIALTNQSDDAEKTRALSLGADLYIVKASMIPSEVVNIVQETLKKKQPRS